MPNSSEPAASSAAPDGLLDLGRNAWRICSAAKVGFIVDGAAYFEAVAAALACARETIYIVGWDLNTAIRVRSDDGGARAETLAALMDEALARNRRLRIYILIWDFASVYALERDLLPLFNLALRRHRRLDFHMDDHHPLGASHHQKVVVVDDTIAFSGGLDLTKQRWDTPEHGADDPRRVDTAGKPYPPFHDVQIAVEGQAAAALGELVRERWHRATGRRIRPPTAPATSQWPDVLDADVEHVRVGISRTQPAHAGDEEVREVERLYLDTIAAARDYLYFENQYFTSNVICEALVQSLSGREGPDIVIVLPGNCSGWLEETTMGSLRARVVVRLREADRRGRLQVYAPVVPGTEPCELFVHAKVLICDDQWLRIGSANLSNRSMGLDTECDVCVEAAEGPDVVRAVAHFRDRLLGEHLGVSPESVGAAVEQEGSLIRAIETLRGGARTLRPVEFVASPETEMLAEAVSFIDPERPVDAEQLLSIFSSGEEGEASQRPWFKIAAALGVVGALALVWRFTPLQNIASVDNLSQWAASLRGHPLAVLAVTGAFVAGSAVMFPITLLIAATAATFDPLTAMVYGLVGALTSGALSYWVGRVAGRGVIRKIAGSKLNRLTRRLSRRGIATMTAARIVPIAPFTVVNLVAGASRVSFRDFLIGSFLGLLPGIAAITVLEQRLEGIARSPSAASVGWMALALVVVIGAAFLLRRVFATDDA